MVEKPNQKKAFERGHIAQNTSDLKLSVTALKNLTHDSAIVQKSWTFYASWVKMC